MKAAAQPAITDVSVRACPLCGHYSKSRWSFDDLQNKVFAIDRKEAVSPFAKNHFFFCLLFKESFLVGLLRVHIKKVEIDNHYILLYTLENQSVSTDSELFIYL